MSGFFLLGFADDIPTLLFSRLLSGIGSGNISAAQAFIADITPPEKRAKTMGLVGVAFSFGFIFGAPIGGQIFSHFGFPWLGWGTGILCALNLLLSIWILPESLKEKASHIKIVIFPVRQIWQTVLHDRGTGLLFLMERGEIGLDLRYTQGTRGLDVNGLKNRNFTVGLSYMHYLGG
jgi:MFS family permease